MLGSRSRWPALQLPRPAWAPARADPLPL